MLYHEKSCSKFFSVIRGHVVMCIFSFVLLGLAFRKQVSFFLGGGENKMTRLFAVAWTTSNIFELHASG
jgi:hypothetical protein